jgi:hypothetical protein
VRKLRKVNGMFKVDGEKIVYTQISEGIKIGNSFPPNLLLFSNLSRLVTNGFCLSYKGLFTKDVFREVKKFVVCMEVEKTNDIRRLGGGGGRTYSYKYSKTKYMKFAVSDLFPFRDPWFTKQGYNLKSSFFRCLFSKV